MLLVGAGVAAGGDRVLVAPGCRLPREDPGGGGGGGGGTGGTVDREAQPLPASNGAVQLTVSVGKGGTGGVGGGGPAMPNAHGIDGRPTTVRGDGLMMTAGGGAGGASGQGGAAGAGGGAGGAGAAHHPAVLVGLLARLGAWHSRTRRCRRRRR
ncbi:MAG TPA: hypothetical protein VE673_13575 [Pseudonocardiaceae bacterium]|nr:hypothetical protein [Pseudonocardiaceae bacterium]